MRLTSSDEAGPPGTGPSDAPPSIPSAPPMSRREFAVRTAIAVGIVAVALVLFELIGLLVLLFAAILVALVIHALADPLVHRLGMNRVLALWVCGMLGLLLPVFAALAFGSEITIQIEIASQRLPTSSEELSVLLVRAGVPVQIAQQVIDLEFAQTLAQLAARTLANAFEFVGAGVLVLFTGIYLAAQPTTYINGILVFASSHRRSTTEELLRDISTELKHWLVAQLFVMVVVGTLTGLGAWLLGVPAPIALGIMAGVLEVVPYLGPILASIPATALGLSVGLDVAALMLGWIFLVQQFEGLLLTPLVLRKAVRLPPAVSLLALVAAGILLGPVGVLLAAPAAVVGFVAYRRLRQHREAMVPAPP